VPDRPTPVLSAAWPARVRILRGAIPCRPGSLAPALPLSPRCS
jgi:hypothetical protein